MLGLASEPHTEGSMGIRRVIVIVFGLAVVSAQAATTNSWKSGSSSFWDTATAWSLNVPPSISDFADFITNAANKTVTIDSFVSTNTLTISNLTVSGVGGTTNTLALNNAGTNVPLHVLNSMMVSNAGVLQVTNSVLQVDGGAGGAFLLTGVMRILNKAKVQLSSATFSNDAVLQFALGTNSAPVAVGTDLALGGTLNVINGGGFTNTTYTLFTYGGALTYNGLAIGTTPSNSTCVVDVSSNGLVNLVVTFPAPPLPFRIVSIVQSTNDIVLTWTTSSAGNNYVQATAGDGNGGYNTNGFVDINGPIAVTAGATTNYVDSGGATNAPSRFYRIRFPQ
jgi:hypothetical protein